MRGAAGPNSVPDAANQAAAGGEVAVLGSPDDKEVRAVVQLNTTPPLMLLIGRPVDPDILDHMHRTEGAVAEYERLDANRSALQVTFALIFALVALLVLWAAVLIGLVLANQIARPVGRLIRRPSGCGRATWPCACRRCRATTRSPGCRAPSTA